MTDQAAMGKIEQAKPPVPAVREADGRDWMPPGEDSFDDDGNWGDGEGWRPKYNSSRLDLLMWIGRGMSVGFLVLAVLGIWRWAMILAVAQIFIIVLMFLDTWWQCREMSKSYVRLVAAYNIAELVDSGIHPVHYRERYELYADMRKNPGKYLKNFRH